MARTQITTGSWTEIHTTTVDTVFSIEDGGARLETDSSTPTDNFAGVPFPAGDKVVVAAGRTVYARATGNSAHIGIMEIG